MRTDDLERRIPGLLDESRQRPLGAAEIAGALKVAAKDRRRLDKALRRLVVAGRIVNIRDGKYALGEAADLVTGRLAVVRSGNGFVAPPDQDPSGPSVFVAAKDLGTALPGDMVLVRLDPDSDDHAQGPRGKVIRVVDRRRHELVGTLRTSGRFLHVVPLAPIYGQNFFVPDARGADIGDRVLVRFVQWENRHVSPEAEILETLGKADDPSVDTLSMIRQHQLRDPFPPEVLQEAESVSERMDIPGRRVDLRDALILTIDPERSRDFDDALSLHPDGEDRVLGVHIADVSHFVWPGSALDREAFARGTSVYLPDKVLPMLPEQLSNGVCSLNPDQDRLAFSVMLRLNAAGQVTKRWFVKTMIRSRARLTYADALAVIENRPVVNPAVTPAVRALLRDLHQLAQAFRSARFARYALDLEMPEIEMLTDGGGVMTGFAKSENDVSHQLVEECMVAANEAVAAELAGRRIPGIARYHEEPKAVKIEELTAQLVAMGFAPGDLSHRRHLAEFLQKVKDDPLAHHVYLAVLKSMNRALYSASDTGHYGLAKTYYSHFTSPIRRYPDLVTHRILASCLAAPGGQSYSRTELASIAEQASQCEEIADLAERDLTEIMKFRFLDQERQRGKPGIYEAVIVAVTHYGVFVELLDLQVQGMVHVSALSGEFLHYRKDRGELSNRGARYRVGDSVQVRVLSVDFDARRLTFGLG